MPQEPGGSFGEHHNSDQLFQEFIDPPMSARPRAWWHWMDGNVDEAGIIKDLEWLAAAGAGGVQAFNGSMGSPSYVAEPVAFRSPAWQSAMKCATAAAGRLGLELSVAASAGWSATGGPWVHPAAGMKKLVWSVARVSPGERALVPPPPTTSGPFQDIPFTAVRRAKVDIPEHYEDVAVLALPARDGHHPLQPAGVSASGDVQGPRPLETLGDGRFWPAASLSTCGDGETGKGTAWVLLDFGKPVAAASVRVGLPAPRGFGSPPAPGARLEASEDGTFFRTVVELPPSASPVRSATFAALKARYYRLQLVARTATGVPVAPGVKPLEVPAAAPAESRLDLTAFQLFAGPRVSRAEEKAGYAPVPDFYAIDGDASWERQQIQPQEVLDLTGRLQADGTLDWEPSEGMWTIVRYGYSLTGHLNAPAPADATGLEVDKLDGGLVAEYLETYLGFFDAAVGKELVGPAGVTGLLSDSIESGPQNWTSSMRDEFHTRRGYDLVPWLPVISGIILGDTQRSDAFLWDFRRTIAELLAEKHYGTLAGLARDRGLRYYAEALEDRRPQLGDDVEMRSHADVPMGAMWCYEPEVGPQHTYVADLRGASSVANVYGKAAVGAESMSAFGKPFMFTPKNLKPVVDMEFALGVNLINIHTSPHQPDAAPKPGVTLSPYLGQAFTRNETWAHAARPWVDYLSRCSHLLQQGRHAADILYFYGEEAPLTGLFGDAAPDVPGGYGFDFINLDGLLNHITVTAEGKLRSSAGVEYRLLYLGGSSHRMTLAAVQRITALVEAGATAAGRRPHCSPSEGDNKRDWDAAVDALWSGRQQGLLDLASAPASSGLAAALDWIGLEPDWALEAAEGSDLHLIHRSLEDGELYFISNQLERPETVRATFRASACNAELWDAVNACRSEVPILPGQHQDTSIDLELAAFGSTFVLLERGQRPPAAAPPLTVEVMSRQLEGPWQVEFHGDGQSPPAITLPAAGLWSGPEAGEQPSTIRYFSGTATYRHVFYLDTEVLDSRLMLDLGEVCDLAEVRLNGHVLGVLWTRPFLMDISTAAKSGENSLEVAVTNSWANRLIGDAAAGRHDRPGEAVFEPEASPLPAGLQGPVKLMVRRVK